MDGSTISITNSFLPAHKNAVILREVRDVIKSVNFLVLCDVTLSRRATFPGVSKDRISLERGSSRARSTLPSLLDS